MSQLRQVNELYQDEANDHRAVKLANRTMQNEERGLRAEIKSLRDVANRGAFMMVLLDGDGMIFNDRYLKAGEAGGREAASTLSERLRKYFEASMEDVPVDYKVIVRVYVNLNGLADACYRDGMLDNPVTLEDFAKGFTGSKILYDMVDVGAGKERADSKIAGQYSYSLIT